MTKNKNKMPPRTIVNNVLPRTASVSAAPETANSSADDDDAAAEKFYTYNDLETWVKETFCGWAYPHAPKASGAMVMVFSKPEAGVADTASFPHSQVTAAIKKTHAKAVAHTPLYQALMRCEDKVALMQPLTLAVSGVSEPALYTVEGYLCPTDLYYDVGTTVFHMAQKRVLPRKIKKTSCFEEMQKLVLTCNTEYPITNAQCTNLQRTLAGVMYRETLVYTSMADSGLRFKDRAATKLGIAERNKDLWEFCRQLHDLNLVE